MYTNLKTAPIDIGTIIWVLCCDEDKRAFISAYRYDGYCLVSMNRNIDLKNNGSYEKVRFMMDLNGIDRVLFNPMYSFRKPSYEEFWLKDSFMINKDDKCLKFLIEKNV